MRPGRAVGVAHIGLGGNVECSVLERQSCIIRTLSNLQDAFLTRRKNHLGGCWRKADIGTPWPHRKGTSCQDETQEQIYESFHETSLIPIKKIKIHSMLNFEPTVEVESTSHALP